MALPRRQRAEMSSPDLSKQTLHSRPKAPFPPLRDRAHGIAYPHKLVEQGSAGTPAVHYQSARNGPWLVAAILVLSPQVEVTRREEISNSLWSGAMKLLA